MGGLQLHVICSHWLVHKEVVEVRSNYRDLTCGDLEISFVVIRLGVAGAHTSWTWGKGGGGGRSGAI